MAPWRGILPVLAAAGAAATPLSGGGARSGYDEREALEAAYLATAAYCGEPKTSRAALEAWRCGPACDRVRGVHSVRQVYAGGRWREGSAFVAQWGGRCLVAFRGSADKIDWLEDVRSAFLVDPAAHGMGCSDGNSSCLVGSGWIAAYAAIRDYVRGNLTAIGCLPGSEIAFTGHSLGGAAAQLAMFDLSAHGYRVRRSYVFGSPRPGNQNWVKAFKATVGDDPLYHVTFRHDPVPHLPPLDLGFVTPPLEVFYDGRVSEGYELCNASSTDGCSARYAFLPRLIEECVRSVHNCDHLHYMTDEKKIPMSGETCATDAPVVDVHV